MEIWIGPIGIGLPKQYLDVLNAVLNTRVSSTSVILFRTVQFRLAWSLLGVVRLCEDRWARSRRRQLKTRTLQVSIT